MTSVVSTRTLMTIAVLTAGLIGLEHATSAVLNLLRGLATTKRFLVFFLTSVAITLFCKRFIGIEDTFDPSVAYLYLDEDEVLSESDDLFEDDSQEYATERDYPQAARSLAPSPSLISRNSRTMAPAPALAPTITRDRLPKTSPLAPTHEHQERQPKPPTQLFGASFSASQTAQNRSFHPQQSRTFATTYSQEYYQPFVHPEPVHYSFAPKSSFLSEYLQSLPKDAVMTPYRYIASTEHSTTRYTFGFPPPIEDARFPVISGLTFPDAIPRVITA